MGAGDEAISFLVLADMACAFRLTAVTVRVPSLATKATGLVASRLMATPIGSRGGEAGSTVVTVCRSMKSFVAEPTLVITPAATVSRKRASAPSDAT